MIIDHKAPIDVPQPTSTEGPSSPTSFYPFADPESPIAMPGRSSSISMSGHPDHAPPSYETAVAEQPPRLSIVRSLLRKPRPSVGSLNLPIGELDLTSEEKTRICPRIPDEHTSPCFLRPAPPASESGASYQHLPRPFVIDPKPGSYTLEDSFATVGTPALYEHDVQESDWEELLGDVRAAARLSPGQRAVSNVLPVTKHLGPPGFFASALAEQGMKRQKTAHVAALLDVWNERFFKPRRLEVILCRGDKRKSGKDIGFLAPDRVDTPPASLPKQRGGCCCSRRKQAAIEKPYRLVVVSL
ncbi:hypothetical protein RhiJN_02076 [Ceratobasidium sp. AG-Ba]|nr:hypothetical protein RhiJN_02076 [Ceratobasidium sp. AG-Ba]